jgi:1,4-dihydroxy-2-naphthoate octaprenyltransferase
MNIFDRIDAWIDAPKKHPDLTHDEAQKKVNLRNDFAMTVFVLFCCLIIAFVVCLFIFSWRAGLSFLGLCFLGAFVAFAYGAFHLPPVTPKDKTDGT